MKVLLVLGLLIILGVWYNAADHDGFIPHGHDATVYIDGTWATGEYRQCDMVYRKLACHSSPHDHALPLPEFYENQSPHVLPAEFYGRIDRTDKAVTSWRCQRNEASLTCRALD